MNDQEPSSAFTSEHQPMEIVQDAEEGDSIFDKLPPEMLMNILRYLNPKDLFLSRLISRQLNAFALEILSSRFLPCLKFTFISANETRGSLIKWNGGQGLKNLDDFLSCFISSTSFKTIKMPYTRFRFDGVRRSTFLHEDWLKFTSSQELGQTVKTLILGISYVASDAEMMELTQIFSRLLLKQLPNLEEFGLSFHSLRSVTPVARSLALFQPPDFEVDFDFEVESEGDVGMEQAQTPQLPRLKTVHLDESSFTNCPRIVKDLLFAAVNLTEIVYNNRQSVWRPEMLEHFFLLQSLGKLDCLQDLTIELTNELLSPFNENPDPNLHPNLAATIIPAFKLKGLTLSLEKIHGYQFLNGLNVGNDVEQIWASASIFLSAILKSSKDTLTNLDTRGLGFLTGLELPVFSKLTHLIIQELEDLEDDPTDFPEAAFPPGIKMAENFPALELFELGIPWTTTFPAEPENNNPISIPMPTLTRLQILGAGVSGVSIRQISTFCPNLKFFQIFGIDKGSLQNFPEVGTAIWTLMKQLQSLELSLDEDTEANAFPAIDSTITGFSREDCETLYDLMKADKLLKSRGSLAQIPQSELQAERKNPSILDLKDLKYLEIRLGGWDRREDLGPLPPVNKKAITFLSEEFALKLMDKLVYDIVK